MDFAVMGTVSSYVKLKNLNFAAKHKLKTGQTLVNSNGNFILSTSTFDKLSAAAKSANNQAKAQKLARIRRKLRDGQKLSDEELRSRFGARIKIMRQFFGLTQAELAARTGTTKATIASYETGRRAASYRNLIALSRTLGVSTDWLLGAEPPTQ